MAYSLKPKRPLEKELARLMRKSLDDAAGELRGKTPRSTSVHNARTSLKKARAILRLLRDSLGGDYKRDNKRLRTASRLLSTLRDADVLTVTIRALKGRYPDVFTTGVQRSAERGLRAHRREARRHGTGKVRRATMLIKDSRGAMARRVRHAGGRSSVEEGVGDGYKRARQAMRGLSGESPAADFHIWRRRTKDHWYHMRLLQRRDRTAASRVVPLKELETILGDAHDLEVLRQVILAHPSEFGDEQLTAVMLGCIDKAQRSMHARALTRGRQIFRRPPGEFLRAITVTRRGT